MENYHNEVKKVLVIVLLLNMIVAALKIAFGHYSGILSISADGYDSFLDAVANVIAVVAVYLSAMPKSKKHPYGYTKIENFASIFIAFLLLFVSYEIFTQAIDKFLNPQTVEISYMAFVIMIISLSVNICLSQYEKVKGKELKSDLLIADSSHTRSDVLVSSIVVVALVLMYFDLSFIDPLVSVVIIVIILKAAIDILRHNFGVLLDASRIDSGDIIDLLGDVDGVIDVHNVRTRGTTSNVYVDMHLVVDSSLSIKKAHEIADYCEKRILDAYEEASEVLIHLESEDGLFDADKSLA